MKSSEPSWWYRNSLSIVLLVLLVTCLLGQALTGWQENNRERRDSGWKEEPLTQYLGGGHFLGALFENWESEFLQMAMYVVLTVRLRQVGSAESRPLEDQPGRPATPREQWPAAARRGGWVAFLYGKSLGLAFLLLFILSFVGHARGSWMHQIEQDLLHGSTPPGWMEHLRGSQFWFECFQNWQSEFAAVLALVLFTIVLRQNGSPQSKKVWEPHSKTGTD